MGNSQAKEARPGSSRGHRPSSRHHASATASGAGGSSHHDRPGHGVYSSRSGRGSRRDLSFLGLGGASERDPALEPRRETKAEREARKLEKERVLRAQERERSIREEGVDGGYLVTLGTYTGPEDFSKPVVRQLQIERRLAPFWKGLEDHSDNWTEYQLVAVVNGLPLPAPDAVPPEEPPRSNNLSTDWSPRGSSTNIMNLTVPISARSMSQGSDRSSILSPSHPAFSLPSPTSPITASTSSSPFFRGRAKTLAALTTGSRNNSQTEMIPQEVQLQRDPHVNGQRIEAFLYKNAAECPICFLYYPPYLNKTRCCDQPICSECFVQIKRPDPHPPEHHGDPSDPPAEPQEDGMLVSEPSACPFCVQPEFGVTYEPPPFRRGLAYANQGQNSLVHAASAMSSSSSVNSQGVTSPGRRRATSLAANDRSVITTDMVRPDWAKKLADARAHALRRAAAATALHNAAYMMGNIQQEGRSFGIGRRRRTMFGSDSPGSSGQGTPRRDADANAPPAAGSSSRNEGQDDLLPGRRSSRRGNRLDDLEELMMMEAIRLSLAAEEERKKKEEKEAAKEAKKEEKKRVKEAKKAEKAARRTSFMPAFNTEDDTQAESSSAAAGKGKAVDRSRDPADLNPPSELVSTPDSSASKQDSQKHLEESRAQIQRETSNSGNAAPLDPLGEQSSHRAAFFKNLSNDSSDASSFAESVEASLRQEGLGGFGSASSFEPGPNESGISLSRDETPPQGTPGTEPMFNFSSLAAVITKEDGKNDDDAPQHIENVVQTEGSANDNLAAGQDVAGENTSSTKIAPGITVQPPEFVDALETAESAQKSQSDPEPESSHALEGGAVTIKPTQPAVGNDDAISPAPSVEVVATNESRLDQKHIGDVSMVDASSQQTTQ